MSTYPSRQNTTLLRSPQSQDLLVPNPKLRLREQVREVMRFPPSPGFGAASEGLGVRSPLDG